MATDSTRAPHRAALGGPDQFSGPGGRASLILALAAAWLLAAPAALAQEQVDIEYSKPARLVTQALALDGVAVDEALVAVGERGHVLVSTDNGGSWTQSEVPTRSMLTTVHFHDRQLGWAAGHDSVILRTSNGGSSWERVHWAPEDEAPFFDVWFRDADYGIAIGAYGSFFETFDGGTTWSSRWISEDDWHLHQLAALPSGEMYIAAEAGSVYRSDDGGENWVTLTSPYEGSFFGVLAVEDAILIFGLRGHLFRSEDRGETWQDIDTGTVAMLTDGVVLADGTVVIVGLGGTVLASSDGGRSFELYPQSNRRGIAAVTETPDGGLFVVGEFGVKATALSDLMTGSGGTP
ncbi:MAG: YCF48-related protein [Holophagae bacterium]|jgi:photosystem II stability/assembly factor-like uncharacterized protein